jgi:hypothetical protein
MFVNIFTVTMSSTIYETAMKEISNEFGMNVPKSLQFDGGTLGFITHLFCVDDNVNIKEICKKYNCEIGEPYKIEIEDSMYNNNYTIRPSYKKEGPRFYLVEV